MFWIWIKKSNKVQELRDMGTQIWDNWEIKSGYWKGTIGPAYGYQLGLKCRKVPLDQIHWDKLDPREISQYKIRLKLSKERFLLLDQVDYLIHSLINNPNSRRMMISMWNVEDLKYMNLQPCAWSILFNVSGNKLNAMVHQRSQDMLTAGNWNVVQYAFLLMLVAKSTGFKAGELVHVIGDCHIYDRHIPLIKEMFADRKTLPLHSPIIGKDIIIPKKNFYDYKVEDIKVNNYSYLEFNHKIPVAI